MTDFPAGKEILCQNCGAENGRADVFCYKCGVRIESENVRLGPVPLWTGILLIIAGGLGFSSWFMVAMLGRTFASSPIYGEAAGFFIDCGTLGMLLAIVPVIGGIMSLRRNFWGTVVGAAVGIFLFGPFYSSSLISAFVLVLVLMSRKEFRLESLDGYIR